MMARQVRHQEKVSFDDVYNCVSLVRPTLKKSLGKLYKKIGAAGMLVAPIKSLAFNLRHQVFVNTLRFTGFDNKMDTSMDAAIETAV